MYLKFMGGVLVCAASGYIGFSASARLSKRVQALGQLIKALEFMQNQITYICQPMVQIAQSLENTAQGAAKQLFGALSGKLDRLGRTDFATLWRECVLELEGINQNDKNILVELGQGLGRYDAEIEAKNIAAAIAGLEFNLEAAGQEHKKYAKMYRGFGLAFGLFVAILLL